MNIFKIFYPIIFALFLWSCGSESKTPTETPKKGAIKSSAKSSQPSISRENTLHIGSISLKPAKEIKKFLPFIKYLAKNLKSEGILKGKVIVAKNMEQMISYLKKGKVDIFLDSPFPSVFVRRNAQSKIILTRWKKGVEKYHTVIFVRKDSKVQKLQDLQGKTLTFEEPFSTSGCLLPKATILQNKLQLQELKKATDPVDKDKIGFVFSKDDDNTEIWVHRKKVVAGATDNITFSEYPKAKDLRIIHKTISVPRQVLSHRPNFPEKIVAKMNKILTEMHTFEEGKKVLLNFKKTKKFTPLKNDSKKLGDIERLIEFVEADLKGS